MIGKLTGRIAELTEECLILDVHDVGYVIILSQRVLSTLREGDDACFFIDTQIKDDKIVLFGFQSPQDQHWFRLLQTVQGVGAKFALSLLSYFSLERLYDLIIKEARTELVLADGVGPKLAARLITELKGPLLKRPQLRGSSHTLPDISPGNTSLDPTLSEFNADLLSALINLGYKRAEALRAIEKVHALPAHNDSLEVALKACLTHLSPH